MGLFSKLVKEAVNSEDYDFEKLAYSFARSVLSYMRQKKITQKDLAEKLNVSEARISKVLSGETNLTLKTIIKIARLLDCKVNDIILSDKDYIYNSIVEPKLKENNIIHEMNFPLFISVNANSWKRQNKNAELEAQYCMSINTPISENVCTGLN